MDQVLGFRDQGLGFRDQGLGFRDQGLGISLFFSIFLSDGIRV